MTSLLLVDDDDDLRGGLARAIARHRPALDVRTAGSATEAMVLLRSMTPELLVTDLCMPGIGGVELVMFARCRDPRLGVIVMSACDVDHGPSLLAPDSPIAYLEKPFRLGQLFVLLEHFLDRQSSVASPSLTDVVCLFCIAKTSGSVVVTCDAATGTAWFEGGHIQHATVGSLEGPSALRHLAGWTGARFELHRGASSASSTIDGLDDDLVAGCACLRPRSRS